MRKICEAFFFLCPVLVWLIVGPVFAAEEGTYSFAPSATDTVVLTASERKFIAENPEIVLGGGLSFEPFLIKNNDGSISGYDVDIAALITERTGLKIRFELGNWSEIEERAAKGGLDGLSSAAYFGDRKRYFERTLAYAQLTGIVIVKRGNPKTILNGGDIAGKRLALQQGNRIFKQAIAPYLDNTEVVYYTNLHDPIRAVVSEEVDFTVLDETVFYVAGTLGLENFIEGAFPVGSPFEVFFLVRKDSPELLSIINKALRSIREDEKKELRSRWFKYTDRRRAQIDPELKLSGEELGFLSAKGSLKICAHGNWMPFERFDRAGNYKGLAADYLALFEEKIGAPLVPLSSGENPLALLKRGECDTVLLADGSLVEDHDLVMTTPYLSFPYVVATTNEQRFIEEIGEYLDKRFAVVKGTPVVAGLRRQYPAIRLLEVSSIDDGLRQVQRGKVFGYIDSSVAISYAMESDLVTGLSISGTLPLSQNLGVATRRSQPLLGHIWQKVVAGLTLEEKKKIINRWFAVKFYQGIDYGLAVRVLLVAAVVVVLTLYWNRRLQREKRRVEAALKAEREAVLHKRNFIDMIAHEFRTPLSVLNSSLDLIERKYPQSEHPELSKQLLAMRSAGNRLQKLFEFSRRNKSLEESEIHLCEDSVELFAVVETAVAFIHSVYPEHSIRIDDRVGGVLLLVADQELLGTAFGNLLDNACKYSLPGEVRIVLEQNGSQAVLTVSDKGLGIRENDLEHVFEKYYRSEAVGKIAGTGTGLFLVKRIIELHGGKITISSVPQQGTDVVVHLPVRELEL